MSLENLRKPWTPADDARLRELLESGKPISAIARELARTQHGVKYRTLLLGLQIQKDASSPRRRLSR
jgi:hypothetical protein